ncbi:hypothetical protein ENU1_162470 [Entamoeba nuttalli P19]|uniref:Uncharacterized protein n=2 Tax=Entamoeba nuttalli TaxID=412467 RepID=K2GU54_ENTNP|nr:hypothetical protein ENU1_162470 [Entamoeba nuttalli P19]EKE38563.1 hypothetical protein ENU1_162470 [Entamoeba nuttalli P19]|eukprot:XP_008859090.1 hypothetical protein ENU1_162470 [Entamoeba nuttalli P19]
MFINIPKHSSVTISTCSVITTIKSLIKIINNTQFDNQNKKNTFDVIQDGIDSSCGEFGKTLYISSKQIPLMIFIGSSDNSNKIIHIDVELSVENNSLSASVITLIVIGCLLVIICFLIILVVIFILLKKRIITDSKGVDKKEISNNEIN